MKYIPVRFFTNYMEAHIALGQLQEQGIDCVLEDENTLTVMPMLTQALGGIKLMVAEPDLAAAKELLQALKTVQQENTPCPKCGSTNIELVSTARKPGNVFTAIASWLLGSYAIAPEKVYHCFNCGNEFELAEPQEAS